MEKEIVLIDSVGNKKVTTINKYILRFNSGANISLDLNDKWSPEGIVCRAWYGEDEWEPSLDGSCHLVLNPRDGSSIWLKPLVLTGTSLFDVKVKAISTELPQVYSIVDNQEQLMSSDVQRIMTKYKKTCSVIEVELPQGNVSPIFQESILITTNNQGISCEPKGCNLWVFKPLVKCSAPKNQAV